MAIEVATNFQHRCVPVGSCIVSVIIVSAAVECLLLTNSAVNNLLKKFTEKDNI